MIQLNDEFFEDEIREGFYVPAEVKQAWGAEIEVLNEIDRVCKKHGIRYFASYGTLLGAVRHGGMIPWDDDFDISMTRKDFEIFMKVWKEEMPQGFDVINYKTHPDHIYFISNVVGKSRICFEKDHLERFHGFPYISGIDIFVLDNMSEDKEYEKYRMKVADIIITAADSIFDGSVRSDEVERLLVRIEKMCNVTIPRNLNGVELRIYLYSVAEKWFAAVGDEESTRMTQVVPWGIKGTGYNFPKEYFDKSIDIPFENGYISTVVPYVQMMSITYGNFMRIVKDATAHEYPYFDGQREDLKKVLDFEMPEYRYQEYSFGRNNLEPYSRENSYRIVAGDAAKQLQQMCTDILSAINSLGPNEIYDYLGGVQKVAIDIGNYIEHIKGEGYITVKKLEGICENVFVLSEVIGSKETEQQITELYDEIVNLSDLVVKDILNRKEVVFLPFKSKYFDTMKNEYERAILDPDTDVYVVPIPYYYKNYDGSLRNMQYNPESYDVPIMNYRAYDMSIHMPDRIYIQNPYDEWNASTSISTQYYSRELLKYTDELIYIPWFRTEEFSRSDSRAYKNMRYYCTVPGVVNADRVIVQSEGIRQLYIDKLSEFAGDETREVWMHKICVEAGELNKKSADKKDSENIIIYVPDLSCILANGMKAIEKIKRSIDVISEAIEDNDMQLWWYEEIQITQHLKEMDEEIYNQYSDVVKAFITKQLGRYVRANEYSPKEIANKCKGYYGDRGVIANYVRNKKKYVMIQNYQI